MSGRQPSETRDFGGFGRLGRLPSEVKVPAPVWGKDRRPGFGGKVGISSAAATLTLTLLLSPPRPYSLCCLHRSLHRSQTSKSPSIRLYLRCELPVSKLSRAIRTPNRYLSPHQAYVIAEHPKKKKSHSLETADNPHPPSPLVLVRTFSGPSLRYQELSARMAIVELRLS